MFVECSANNKACPNLVKGYGMFGKHLLAQSDFFHETTFNNIPGSALNSHARTEYTPKQHQ